MHETRLNAQRASLLVLAVVALHVLLIGSVASRLAVMAAPHGAHKATGLAVRTVELKPVGVQADTSVAQARPSDGAPATTLHEDSRELIERAARRAARTATQSKNQSQPGGTPHPVQTPAQPGPDRMALLSPANTPSVYAEALSPALPATETAPIDPGPATALDTRATQSALPIYPTRTPPAFAFAYTLTRGAFAYEVELRWQPEGERYVASLEGRDGNNALLAWRSVGGFDAAGIAPLRFVDRRRGRSSLAANFQRDAGKVTFSGPQIEHALTPGAQDRLSWMLQLAAIAAADPARAETHGVAMIVVGARGEADVWRFEPLGQETLELAEGAVPALRFLRRPERTYDTRAEVWLVPSYHYLPLRVRLSNGGETLQLAWRGAATSP